MNEEAIERAASSRLTRRTIVTTGTKLAYAAPLVAASFKLSGGAVFAADAGWVTMQVIQCPNDWCIGADEAVCKVVVCHRTCSAEGGNQHNGYSAIEIPEGSCGNPSDALAQHLAQHAHPCGLDDVLAENVVRDDHGHAISADCPGGGVGNPSIA